MAYSESLVDRIRELLVNIDHVEEKHMFGGVCFMVNGKMCAGVIKNEMMCRIDPAMEELVLEETACRQMDFSGRPMKGYVFVGENGMRTKKDLNYWLNLCLEFNPKAKATKKKMKKK